MNLNLKLLLPTHVLLDREVSKIVAEGEDGFFCLLPRHIDFLSALVPGLLSFVEPQGREEFVAVDEGILVKNGPEVLVSTRQAVYGPDLGTLQQTVEQEFAVWDERERQARSAIASLEADFVRRFLELGDPTSL